MSQQAGLMQLPQKLVIGTPDTTSVSERLLALKT